MEARISRAMAALALAICLVPSSSLASSYRTPNFVIEAPTPELAEKIGKTAEYYRRELAIQWLGAAMPNWSRPCPIQAEVGPTLGAGGATSFVFDRGEVFNWDMKIQGTEERLLDSVLPHEVTHTIFASHFRRPLPRWADEGACTTVEHASERNKQQVMLINFLRTGHGIAFDQMFAMKEYPPDVLPLYSQGYSLARYLIDQGGRQEFLEFVGDGLKSENWSEALNKHYGVANLKSLQDQWLTWVKQGSPDLSQQKSTIALASAKRKLPSSDTPVFRAQSDDRQSPTASNSKSSGTELASLKRLEPQADDRSNAWPDRGWTAADKAAKAGTNADLPRTASRESDTASPHQSVYERRPDSSQPPTSPAAASSTAPSSSSADASRREPQLLAQRDVAADAGHRVLLEWTKRE